MFRRIGVFFTIVAVALSLMALPALAHHEDQTCPDLLGDTDNQHPSGKDRHCESGGSGTQGKAKSDPDDDGRGPDRTNGGMDQAGETGGVDHADQDGNNGCGNDDDFEDDNEGWCGKNPKARSAKVEEIAGDSNGSTSSPSEVLGSGSVTNGPTEVLGSGSATTASPMIEVLSGGATLAPKTTEVLGAGFVRSTGPKGTAVLGEQWVRGQALAATGIDSSTLLLAGLLLAIAGLIMVRMSKTQSEAVAPTGIIWE
ncbi:MAG: hypothetical protein KY429_03030 [Actinobacteria bacterium]|nr:hypothetical protein [Actinomycetota bacterium]